VRLLDGLKALGFSSSSAPILFTPADLPSLYVWLDTPDPAQNLTLVVDKVVQWDGAHPTTFDATQPLSASQPTYLPPDRVVFDKIADNMSLTFTEPVVGSLIQSSSHGITVATVDIPAGGWSFTTNPAFFPGSDAIHLVMTQGELTSEEIEDVKAYMARTGAGVDFSGLEYINDFLRIKNRSCHA
jgi:hypothetical protein